MRPRDLGSSDPAAPGFRRRSTAVTRPTFPLLLAAVMSAAIIAVSIRSPGQRAQVAASC
jgi:hypothetical protein